MKAITRRLSAAAAAVGMATVLGAGTAHAAGGNGATECSNAGNPATTINPGALIREHQPFGGNGNDGSNPGFNFNGFSGCKPA
jgi:hypothetical protein